MEFLALTSSKGFLLDPRVIGMTLRVTSLEICTLEKRPVSGEGM